jgi:hypothetical protein
MRAYGLPCLLCKPPPGSIEQFALAPADSGRASSALNIALATITAAALLFATRLYPFQMLPAGGILGFAGVV